MLKFSLSFFCLLNSTVGHCVELSEYQMKASFIYNFISYTQWPKRVNNQLNLCIYGPNLFEGALNELHEMPVNGNVINVIQNPNSSSLNHCQIIYIEKNKLNNLSQLLTNITSYPILTISDVPNSVDKGIIININIKNNKVRFDINKKQAEEQQLIISSRLLRLADKVIK